MTYGQFIIGMDATYKTNQHGYPFFLFTVVDNHSHSYPVAIGLSWQHQHHQQHGEHQQGHQGQVVSFNLVWGGCMVCVGEGGCTQDRGMGKFKLN